jgi:hypothetical protein
MKIPKRPIWWTTEAEKPPPNPPPRFAAPAASDRAGAVVNRGRQPRRHWSASWQNVSTMQRIRAVRRRRRAEPRFYAEEVYLPEAAV